MATQIVVFQVNNQSYGLDIQEINEIIRMQEMTSIPNTADYMEGIANLRGSIYSILNGRLLLGLPKEQDMSESKIMVFVEGNIGMVVDHVTEILSVEEVEKKTFSGMSGLESMGYIDYLYELGDQIVTVLNLKALIDLKNNPKNQEVSA